MLTKKEEIKKLVKLCVKHVYATHINIIHYTVHTHHLKIISIFFMASETNPQHRSSCVYCTLYQRRSKKKNNNKCILHNIMSWMSCLVIHRLYSEFWCFGCILNLSFFLLILMFTELCCTLVKNHIKHEKLRVNLIP